MVKRRSHTKRRKHRGGVWYDPRTWLNSQPTVAEKVVPAVGGPLNTADRMAESGPSLMNRDASNALGTSPLGAGETSAGGRRRRRGSRKTKRRRGGSSYY